VTVLAVVGPTASGKTALSIPLALRLDGEIISMDSRQVYRGMDIGTDKVDGESRALVRHHGLDIVDPDERYSAGRFGRDARRWLEGIRERNHQPMLVGGTGFFLRALTNPVFREPPMDRGRRERLGAWLARQPREELVRWVRTLDVERAAIAEAGGPQRMARTAEVAILTGRPLGWWHKAAPPDQPAVSVRTVLLTVPPEVLAERIDRRAERMFDTGLLEEVEGLVAAGFRTGDPGMSATGYREAAAVLEGRLGLDEAVDQVRRVTRAYARRQRTWFRHQLAGDVLGLDALLPLEEQVDRVCEWWQTCTGTGGGREG
jgi:tRNA dimethylallyltransferase